MNLSTDQRDELISRFQSVTLDPIDTGRQHLTAAEAAALVDELEAVLAPPASPQVAASMVEGTLTIACDGSCLSNPDGPTGWAWVASDGRSDHGGLASGTNNIGELLALINALQAHPNNDLHIQLDSQYVLNSVTKWIPGWKRKNWKTAAGKPVANVELMKELDSLVAERKAAGVATTWEWVKGHNNHPLNEAADKLAGDAARRYA